MSDSHLVMIDCGLLPEGVALAAPVPRKTASGAWGGSVSEVLPPEAVASLPLERESGQFLLLKSYGSTYTIFVLSLVYARTISKVKSY